MFSNIHLIIEKIELFSYPIEYCFDEKSLVFSSVTTKKNKVLRQLKDRLINGIYVEEIDLHIRLYETSSIIDYSQFVKSIADKICELEKLANKIENKISNLPNNYRSSSKSLTLQDLVQKAYSSLNVVIEETYRLRDFRNTLFKILDLYY